MHQSTDKDSQCVLSVPQNGPRMELQIVNKLTFGVPGAQHAPVEPPRPPLNPLASKMDLQNPKNRQELNISTNISINFDKGFAIDHQIVDHNGRAQFFLPHRGAAVTRDRESHLWGLFCLEKGVTRFRCASLGKGLAWAL